MLTVSTSIRRYNNLLSSVFMLYGPEGNKEDERLDAQAVNYGKRMRDEIVKTDGKPLDAYVNYAYGDEGLEAVYGHEAWRIEKLRRLKEIWDPEGKFNYYNPIR